MTVAVLQALALRRQRRRGGEPLPGPYFREIARVVDVPWQMAIAGDLAYPGVAGRRAAIFRLFNAYVA
jgi:hypothetical protein